MHFAAVATMLGGDGMAILEADSTEQILRQEMTAKAWEIWRHEMTIIVANGIGKAFGG